MSMLSRLGRVLRLRRERMFIDLPPAASHRPLTEQRVREILREEAAASVPVILAEISQRALR